jgi:hypothetical protein
MKLHIVPLSLLFATTLASAQNTIPWDATDLGPFHSACFKFKIGIADQVTAKGIAIKVGGADAKATVLFDTELLRWTAAWTGGFIELPRGRGGLEGQTKPPGPIRLDDGRIIPGATILFSTGYAPGWAEKDIGEDPRPQHQGNLAGQGAKWRGLYVNGDQVVLNYVVNGGTSVLELPSAQQREGKLVFTRTLTVGQSKGAAILIADVPGSSPVLDGSSATLSFKAADGLPHTVQGAAQRRTGRREVRTAKGWPPDAAAAGDRQRRHFRDRPLVRHSRRASACHHHGQTAHLSRRAHERRASTLGRPARDQGQTQRQG